MIAPDESKTSLVSVCGCRDQPVPPRGGNMGWGIIYLRREIRKGYSQYSIRIDGIERSLAGVIVNVQLLNGKQYSLMIQHSHALGIIPERETFGATALTYGKLGGA